MVCIYLVNQHIPHPIEENQITMTKTMFFEHELKQSHSQPQHPFNDMVLRVMI